MDTSLVPQGEPPFASPLKVTEEWVQCMCPALAGLGHLKRTGHVHSSMKGVPGPSGGGELAPLGAAVIQHSCLCAKGDELRLLQQRRELHCSGPALHRGLNTRPVCAEGGKFCHWVSAVLVHRGSHLAAGAGPGGIGHQGSCIKSSLGLIILETQQLRWT